MQAEKSMQSAKPWPARWTLAVLLFTFFAWALPAQATPAPQTLQLGFFAYRPKALLEAQWQPLVDYLNTRLEGRRLVLRILSQQEMQQALDRQELDFVFTNPAHYVHLRTHIPLSGALATLVSLENGSPSASLAGVVVRLDTRTDLQTLQHLRGQRVAVAGTQYLGGYTAQAEALVQQGVAPSSLKLLETGQPHDRVLQAVLQGQADAGFVRSGVLESVRRAQSLDTSRLVVMAPKSHPGFAYAASTRLFPEWPFVSLPHVAAATGRRLASLLLGLEPDHPAAVAAGIHGFTVPTDYSQVESAMQTLRIPPFDRAPQFTWADMWQRYQLSASALLAATLALGALAATLALGRRRMAHASRSLQQSAAALHQEHARLTNIIAGTAAGTWEWSVTTGAISINARWAHMLGYTLDELAPISIATWWRLTLPQDLAKSQALLQAHFRGETDSYDCELRMRHKQGHWVWIHDRDKVVERGPHNEVLHISGTHHDITPRKQAAAEQALAASVFEHSHDGILITDADNRIVNANPAFTRTTGYALSECLGQKPDLLNSGHQPPAFYAELWSTLYRDGCWQGELLNRHKDGSLYPQRLFLSLVRDSNHQPSHHLAVVSDISAQKSHESALDRRAYYDALTDIPNRHLFNDRLTQATALARRSQQPMAVCMMDLDGFKQVNDTWGHGAGDQLLVHIAQRLQRVVRAEETVARLGGDEFALIFYNCQSPAVFERLLSTVREPVPFGDCSLQVSASLGVAFFHPSVQDGEQLLRQADQAMYQSKSAGRDRVTVWSETATATATPAPMPAPTGTESA